jgi:hypothetical protein
MSGTFTRLSLLDVSKEKPGAISSGGVVASSLFYGCGAGGGVGGLPFQTGL